MYREIALRVKLRRRGYSVRKLHDKEGREEWWIYKDRDFIPVGAYRKAGDMLVYAGYETEMRKDFEDIARDLSLSFRYIIDARDERILFKRDGIYTIGRNLRNRAFLENLME